MNRPMLLILMGVIGASVFSGSHSPPRLFVANPAAYEPSSVNRANCWHVAAGGGHMLVMGRVGIGMLGCVLERCVELAAHPRVACGVPPLLAGCCRRPNSSGRATAAYCRSALLRLYLSEVSRTALVTNWAEQSHTAYLPRPWLAMTSVLSARRLCAGVKLRSPS